MWVVCLTYNIVPNSFEPYFNQYIYRTLHLWYSYTLRIHQKQEFNITVQPENSSYASVNPTEFPDLIDEDLRESTRINKFFRLTQGRHDPRGKFELRLTITDKTAGRVYRTKFWPPSMGPVRQASVHLPSKWRLLHNNHLDWTLCQEKYNLKPRFVCPTSKRKIWSNMVAQAQRPLSLRRRYVNTVMQLL